MKNASSNNKSGNNGKSSTGNTAVATTSNAQDTKKKTRNRQTRRQQPKKDSASKRVNYDNAREDKVAKQIMADAKSGKYNDINDFLKNPTLLKAAGSIPVFPILGLKNGNLAPVPGIMQILWFPNFGSFQSGSPGMRPYKISVDDTVTLTPPPVALNQAADNIYSYIVHANSRNYSYNSSDLMLLILAGSQVFCILRAMMRAYGIAKQYTETNQYRPDTELSALGFNAQNLRENLAQAWFDLNNLIVQTRQIWVPNVLPLVGRWMDLNSHFYKDAPGDYAQEYVFVQAQYYQYDQTFSTQGGCLVPARTKDASGLPAGGSFTPGVNKYSWSQWCEVAQSMIDALISSEDRGIIYGDMLQAYGADKIMALPEFSVDYLTAIEYTPEISMQIENLSVAVGPVPTHLFQFANKLWPAWDYPSDGFPARDTRPTNAILNFHITDQPTPEMVMTATRFMTLGSAATRFVIAPKPSVTTYTPTDNLQNGWLPIASGTEIITGIVIYIAPSTINSSTDVTDYTVNLGVALDQHSVFSFTQANACSMSFDWHPFLSRIVDDSLVTASKLPEPTEAQLKLHKVTDAYVDQTYGDHDKYTEITWQMLSKLHDTAEFSLYGVPQL